MYLMLWNIHLKMVKMVKILCHAYFTAIIKKAVFLYPHTGDQAILSWDATRGEDNPFPLGTSLQFRGLREAPAKVVLVEQRERHRWGLW